MNISDYIWREDVVDKLAWKHQVEIYEVVEVFENNPRIERLERGHRPAVFFIHKKGGQALIVTARDMTRKERRRYGRK